jgi:hypothetical protein
MTPPISQMTFRVELVCPKIHQREKNDYTEKDINLIFVSAPQLTIIISSQAHPVTKNDLKNYGRS